MTRVVICIAVYGDYLTVVTPVDAVSYMSLVVRKPGCRGF